MKKSGCSALQGKHQLAKKLIIIMLFFKSLSDIESLSLSKLRAVNIGIGLFKSALGGFVGSDSLNM